MTWTGLGRDTALPTDEKQNHRCHQTRRNKMNLRLGDRVVIAVGRVWYCVQREMEELRGERERERERERELCSGAKYCL